MIRVWIKPDNIYIGGKAYAFDVTDFENKHSDYYDNLLTEDLVERISQGDILMYFDSQDSAKEWCEDYDYEYIYVEPDENK